MAFDTNSHGSSISQINVVPLVDIMLVLLVIFMVAAPIMQQGVAVDLPKVKAGALQTDQDPLVVTVDRAGKISLNDVAIAAADLTAKLEAVARLQPDKQVFLRADTNVPYGAVVKVMAAVKGAGIENLGMVTELPTEAP